MSTILVPRPPVLKFHRDGGFINHRKFNRISATLTMTMDSKSSRTNKKEDFSLASVPQSFDGLRFDRLQPSDQELLQHDRFKFGKFVAREALLDEEYWTAAWLRAESHWEHQANERYVDNFKRKFAEQEFNAIKRRCRGLNGQQYSCIVTVRKDERNVKRTVLKSVVGTLDLSIRYLLQGEAFPGERLKAPVFGCIDRKGSNRYGYIANLCVAKSARRQGIASNMLHFAIESAKSNDVEHVYVRVYRSNIAGQQLYEKLGFKMVEMESSQFEETDLLCIGI